MLSTDTFAHANIPAIVLGELAPEVTVDTSVPLTTDLLIVGGGIAGLTAGIYAGRAGVNTVLAEGSFVDSTDYEGGQVMLTQDIANFPGYTGKTGTGLIDIARTQALDSGVQITSGARAQVISEHQETGGFITSFDAAPPVLSRSIILATGAISRRLQVPGEDEFFGMGVSSCATCDGAFFSGADVAVIGGGDSAVEDALYLSRIAKSVTVVVRGDKFKAQGIELDRLLETQNVTVLYNSSTLAITGTTSVEALHLTCNGTDIALAVQGVFVAIGRNPQNHIVHASPLLEGMLRADGYISTPRSCGPHTRVPGIFAAGDVMDGHYNQAIVAAASGAKAAIRAAQYLQK